VSVDRERAERVGARHEHSVMLEARRRTRAAVREVARQVAPGMSEEEGLELARRTLRAHGFERDWVEPYLRFGRNTLKKYAEPADPGVLLAPDDVWFIDVGPLWRNHECDYAESFAVGADPERHRIVRDVRAIFDRTSRHWREAHATGVGLYRFAAAQAELLGWQLDPEMAGHRLGEYPHAAFHDGLLGNAEFTPSPGLWMLEIQLRHPDRPYSAFFEDLLLDVADA
jgi:Xaa-Pro aminopeptidase